MNRFITSLQNTCRSAIRPVAAGARRLLTPAVPPVEFGWHKIEGGSAKGVEAILPKGRPITEAITAGTYEQSVIRYVVALVDRGDTCFDIGGHYGYYTFVLAKLAPEGAVHTFEPVAAHAERIAEGATRSALKNVAVHRCAVAGEVGKMSLQYAESDDADDSMAFLDLYGGVDTPSAHEHYQSFARTEVETVTLDSLLDQVAAPRFIKIDAEGAEAAIVEGGRKLIQKARPRLLIELHGIIEAIRCAEILSGLDYHAILLTDQKITMPILWVPREDQEAVQRIRKEMGSEPTILFESARPSDQL